MTYVAHPYASATPSPGSSPSSGIKTRPMRPTLITPIDTAYSLKSKRSPSPITFARASVINPLSPVSSHSDAAESPMRRRNEKRDRRRGLLTAEKTSHAGLDALLRAPEAAAPRAAPQPHMPHLQLVRSPTNVSVTPTIVHGPRVPNGTESDGSSGSSSTRTPTPRGMSPTPSSGSGSAPSTPGQPRTPVSPDFERDHEPTFAYPSVAPLSICKSVNRTPSPSPPSKLRSIHQDLQINSKENTDADECSKLSRRGSRGRFSARVAAAPRARHLFAGLEVDTVASRALDTTIDPPTLTGVLAEFERETLDIPPVPRLPIEANPVNERAQDAKQENENEEDESEWLDVEEDPLEDAEYYRADIASHLQLFSSNSEFTRSSSRASQLRQQNLHRSDSSASTSSVSRWQVQLPPARPDSLPPPPHFLSRFSFQESSHPPLPDLSALAESRLEESTRTHVQNASLGLRRASASSLASTSSARSNRSNRSSGSAGGRNKNRRRSKYTVARRSAASALNGAGGSGSVRRKAFGSGRSVSRPLPPIPGPGAKKIEKGGDESKPKPTVGPCATLDPTYMDLPLMEEITDTTMQSEPRRRTRPPPRFSIPVSVNEDDLFGEDDYAYPMPAVTRTGMTKVVEEEHEDVDEDEDEDGLIDPFVLDSFPMVGVSPSTSARREESREGVDPFTIPVRSGSSNSESGHPPLVSPSPSLTLTLSPPPLSSSSFEGPPNGFSSQQTLLLVPDSPAPLSSFGGSGSGSGSDISGVTFDAESLYNSYAASSCFSPSLGEEEGGERKSDVVGGRKESCTSVYLDASGRPLQSRWSVSTFASSSLPPPTSTSARSFFPMPKLGLPSRLSARLRAARERAVHKEEKPPVVRPFPFFPTPTPPSPKRSQGPGRYVPKPELMPPKMRAEAEKAKEEKEKERRSCETDRSRTSSSSSASTATSTAQYAHYRTASSAHLLSPSPSSSVASASAASPPRSLKSRSRSGSTDSLSAFPFVLSGLGPGPTGGVSLGSGTPDRTTGTRSVTPVGGEERGTGTWTCGSEESATGSGLKRKAIPHELFLLR